MVSAAIETAVNASISMPVWAATRAVAVMAMWSGWISKLISQWLRPRGWQRGMRSPVFLAAMMPARRAVARTLPLAISLDWIFWSVAGWRIISPRAMASRCWMGLDETSTMETLPCLSRWVRSDMLVIFLDKPGPHPCPLPEGEGELAAG